MPQPLQGLGIDYLVSPERIAAKEIANLLKNTAATEIFDFSDSHLSIMMIKLEEGAPVIGNPWLKSQKNIKAEVPGRGHPPQIRTRIPHGEDVFQEGDMAYVVTQPDGIDLLLQLGGKKQFQVKNIMIVGGGAVGSHAALSLEKRMNVKLFELNPQRSQAIVGKP
jgi:trk system potassium uptake protein